MRPTLFFDIDSTLVENRFSRKALGILMREIAQMSEKSIQELGREMGQENDRRQQDDPDNVLTMVWDDIIETIALRYGVTLSQKGIDLWHQFAHADAVEVLDNAPLVLADLRQRGYKLVIATKGLTKYQEPVLRVTDLLRHFDDILTPDKTGYLKTTPSYFDGYRQQDAGPFIQIGDHYYDDVICAKRNGFTAIMRVPIPELLPYSAQERVQYLPEYRDRIPTYPKQDTDIVPDYVVVSLEELPDLLDEL